MRTSRPAALLAATLLLGGTLPSGTPALARQTHSFGQRAAIYAALGYGGLYRSLDGGDSWQEADRGLPAGTEVTALAVNANGIAYAGTKGAGVFISADQGQSWQADNNGMSELDSATIAGLAVNSRYPADIYAATRDGEVYVSYSSGQSWYAPHLLGEGTYLASLADDPSRPETLLVGAGDGIYRSTGYDFTAWQQVDGIPSGTQVKAVTFSPRNADVAYAATDDGIYRSTDGGATWQAERRGIDASTDMSAVAVSPRNDALVVAATTDGTCYRSTDGGTSWAYAGGAAAAVTTLAFDPAHPGQVLAGTTGAGLYRSTDGGATWGITNPNFGQSASVLALATTSRPALPTDPVPPVGNSATARYFSQTHHILRAAFIPFYDSYGGLKVFGLPLSEAFVQNGALVQVFERALLRQKGSRVQVAPLGSLITAGRAFPAAAPSLNSATRRYFADTRHSLSGRFLTFWQTHHGPQLFGSPISEPLREQNGDGTGRTYLVQYFQNARMEYHPELSGTGYEVSLGLVGRQYLKQIGLL